MILIEDEDGVQRTALLQTLDEFDTSQTLFAANIFTTGLLLDRTDEEAVGSARDI